MIVIDFIERMKPLGIFSISDIATIYPDLDKRRLFEWKNKGYIVKIRSGWYCLPEFLNEPYSTWIIANLVHAPSYISLETALDHYDVIPEGVYMTTSVTTNRPLRINMTDHFYSFLSLKTAMFKGYQLLETGAYSRRIRIADLEKAIVDFFYFRTGYNTIKAISALRFNEPVLRDQLNVDRLFQYLREAGNSELEKRVKKMLKIYTDA
ncbi:MAG: hypothetical protein WD577_03240 [Bacteroidales bacterium]